MVEHQTENLGVAGSIPALGISPARGGRQAHYQASWNRWRAIDDDSFRDVVSASRYVADVLRALGLELSGGNYVAVRRRVERLALDTSHWLKSRPRTGRPLEAALVPGGYKADTNRTRIKRALIAAGLLENRCAACGMPPLWHGRALVLVLDHVNGVNDDYTATNLRLLCPNCNSQQATFAGRNARRGRREARRGRVDCRCPPSKSFEGSAPS